MTSTATLASIVAAARTEKGRREENQDAMTGFTSPFGSVHLIADGMGGQQGGAAASLMVAECYRKYLTSLSATLPLAEALQRATSATNSEVRLRSQSGDPSVAGMGSTVVMIVLAENGSGLKGTVAHIGDSRAYLLRHGQLRRLTRDHSAVQRLVDSQQITAEEARLHPDANVITRALGQQNDLLIEVSEEPFEIGDTILLCSDGLSGYVPDQAIAAELSQPRPADQIADSLIALALHSGSSDNITVQVLRLESPQPGANQLPAFVPAAAAPSLSATQTPSAGTSQSSFQRAWIIPLRYFGAGLLGLFVGMLLTGGVLGARLHWMGRLPFMYIARAATSPCSEKSADHQTVQKQTPPDASKSTPDTSKQHTGPNSNGPQIAPKRPQHSGSSGDKNNEKHTHDASPTPPPNPETHD